MSFNKKTIRNIIIAAVVLGLLIAGYIFALKWEPDNEDNSSEDISAVQLVSISSDDVAQISIKNADAEFSIVREETDDKTVWSIPEKAGIEFSQTMLESEVLSLGGFFADKEITDETDKSAEYGLAAPMAEVTLKAKDGKEETLILGDAVVASSGYYIMKKDGDKIYSVSEYKGELFLKQPNDFRERTLGTIDISTMKSFSVSRGGARIFEIINTDGTDEKANTSLSSLRMTYPNSETVSTDKFSKVTEPYNSVNVTDFVSDNLFDLASFGLDNGCIVEIEDETAKHKLVFGNTDENGNVYTLYNDNGFVFTTSAEMLNAVKDVEAFDLVERFAHIYNIDDVESITVKTGDKEHVLSMTRTGSGDDVKTTYKMDGKESEEDAFKGMYQSIIGLYLTNETEVSDGGEKVCEITFKMTDGKKNTASYYTHDERNLRVVRPDGQSFLMLKKYLTSMTEQLEKFAENPKEKP